MNRIYKVIWSKVKHQYVVVSELAHSCTKSTSSRIGRSAAAVLAALVLTTGVGALSVQAADPLVEDPYAILNDKIDETNANSSDPIVTLKSTAAAMNTDAVPAAGSDAQSGSSGNTSVATPSGQHTILNEDGFYAHNGQGTYNSLTKDGLFVGGTDNGEGLYVDNDGNIYTDGNAEVEGSLSAANRNFEVNEDGTLYARAGQSQFQVRGDLIGIQQGNSYIAVTEEDGAVFGNGTEGKETQINGDVVTTGTVNTTNLNAGKADIEGTMTAGSAVIEGTATVGGSLTAGSISTEGQLSAGSAVISGNATIDGMATVGGLTTEGTVTAANADITNLEAGKATVEGTLTAGSADITNSATVGGTLTAGDIETAGTVTAANADITNLKAGKATIEGTITAGSADITNSATVGGTLTAGDIKTAGTVTAANADITNLEAGKATIEGTITAGSADITNSATVGGTLTAGDIKTAGTVTAANADITNLEAGKATIEGTITAGSADITNSATVGGTLIAGDIKTAGTVTAANADITNLEAGKATIEGTITAGSADITNSATVGGTLTAGDIKTAGTVTAANADITNLEAGKATVEGTVRAGSFANTNGSFTVDDFGDVEANDMTAKGDVSGATFANTTDTFAVGADGNVKAADITSTGDVTARGNVEGATFSNTNNTFSVNASGDVVSKGDVSAVDVTASGALTGATIANASNSFKVDTYGNVSANNVTALNEVSGMTFANTLNTFSVDDGGNITGESIIVDGKTYISSSGLNANDSVISNVGKGDVTESSTDAVNGSQLYEVRSQIKTYTAGNGIDIDEADNNKISIKKGNGIEFDSSGNVTVKAAQDGNIVVDANGVSLSKTVSGLTSLSTDALAVTNNATVDGTLGVTGATTLGALTTNGTATFSQGASMNGQKITGVQAGTEGTDAVNRSQLDAVQSQIKTYTAGDGIAIDEGDNNKISIKKGNGIEFDSSGNVTVKAAQDGNIVVDANGVSLSKEVSGLTSLSTAALEVTNNATVGGTLSVTGAISGGSVTAGTGLFSTSVTIGNATSGLKLADGEITGLVTNKIDSDTDAVNVEYLETYVSQNGTGKTYTAGNGIAIDEADNNKISVKTAADGNLKVDSNGVALKDEISLTSVTTSGAVTVGGALRVNGATILSSTLNVTGATTLGDLTTSGTATFNSGASMNNQKITNVKNGDVTESSTDAVNGSQLYEIRSQIKTYTAGDGIAIDEGDNNKISIKKGNGIEFDSSGNVTVKAAQDGNLVVDANGVSLSKEVRGLTSLNTAALEVTNNATIGGTLGVTGAVTAGSVTATDGFTIDMNNSLTSSGLTIGGTAYVTSSGLNAGDKVITGVRNGEVSEDSTEAVNGSQLYEVKQISDLAVTYRDASKQEVELAANNGTGTKLTNVANGTLSSTSKEAVNGSQLYATNQIVGDGEYNSHNYITRNQIDMDLTDAVSALDAAIGNNRYTSGNILDANTDGQTYTSITAAVDTLNRSIGSLTFNTPQSYFSVGTHFNDVTTALNELSGAIGPMQFDTTNNFIDNDSNLSSAIDKLDENIGSALKNVGFRTDASGKVTTDIDWTGSSYENNGGTTIISAVKDLDGRVTNLEAAGQTLSAFSRSNISALSTLSNMDVNAVNALSSLSADDLSKLSEISVASDVSGAAETSGTNTTNNSGRPDRGPGSGADDSISHDGDTVTVDNNVKVTGDTDLQGNLNVGGDTTLGGKLEVGGDATFNGNVDMNGTLNMNNNKITGVADGEISADSTDAVNGSQLHDAWQQINSNTENIGILGSAVNKLGDRIERVGAGAAALAALHPLDFDPDNKLDFAAGFGNYRGASAVAVGAFYRPSENVMFSVGGAFGGGEDMVNAGVSFKVGAGSGSATTSRTAMAKSLKSMQEVVATQDAQLAQQREQIEKLTAMVELLMEQSGQTQPKDDGADTAQPQQ